MTNKENAQRIIRHSRYKHGFAGSKIYQIWNWMMTRCRNKKAGNYYLYGGRGITVADEWLDPLKFIEDMSLTYFKGASLDRIDNDKGYSKENCRWVERVEQARNKRNVVLHGKDKLTVPQIAKKLGMNQGSVHERLRRGWTSEQMMTTPKIIPKSKGVMYDKARGKYRAYTSRGKKSITIGRFDTEKEAIEARTNYLLQTFNLN